MQLAADEFGGDLRVVSADSASWLQQLEADARPQVVYLDPMFEETGRAQVKKPMQACRALAGPPHDAPTLLRIARTVATERVVVKRHPHHAPLADAPSHTVPSGRVRFDVYLTA